MTLVFLLVVTADGFEGLEIHIVNRNSAVLMWVTGYGATSSLSPIKTKLQYSMISNYILLSKLNFG